MGFSVGNFLSGVGSLVSGVFGKSSPAGALIGGGLQLAGSALTPSGSPPGRATTPTPAVSPRATQSSPALAQNITPGFQRSIFGAGGGGTFGVPRNVASLGKIGGAAVGAGSALITEGIMGLFGGDDSLSDILKEARENVKGASKNKIIDAAKFCGIERASSMFGISENQVCMIIVHGRSRRRRGISASDIRRTKRVIRFNKRLTKDLRSK